MTIDKNESINRDLYDLLRGRGFFTDPKDGPKDTSGQTTVPEKASFFRFTFKKDGKTYGDARVSIDAKKNLTVYYGEEQRDSPSSPTPGVEYDDTWSGLIKDLRMWALTKHLLNFELKNKDRLGDDLRQREHYKMKEKLGESYHPMGKKASYNDAVPNVKIVLQHNRSLEEGEARFRNVARIYLENVDGERFLAPTTRPGIARIFAREIAEGGKVNGERWNHLKDLCEEYQQMAGFVRATRNGQFNESAQELINEGINHYNNLRETLKKLSGHRGYHAYFESWTPTLMEGEGEDISEMFMSSSLDPRIESAMPILSRLHKPPVMNEVNSLGEWADSIIEEKLELSEEAPEDDKPIGKGKVAYDVIDATGKKKVTALADYPDAAKELAATHWGLPNTAGIRVTKKEVPTGTTPTDTSTTSTASGAAPLNKAQSQASTKNSSPAAQKGQGTWADAKQSMKQNWNAPADALTNIGKLGAALVGVAEDELNEMDKSPEANPYHGWGHSKHEVGRGPDKTATPVTAKQATKKAGKELNKAFKKAFKGELEEDLGPEQKRVGQLGPTEKVKNNNIGKLVGASESKEIDPELARIIEMAKFKR